MGVTVPRALPGLRSYWLCSIQGGGAYIANKLKVNEENNESFRPQYSYGAEVLYMRHGQYGLGLKYADFHTLPRAKEFQQNAHFWLLGLAVRYEYALQSVPLSFYGTMVFGYMQMNTTVFHAEIEENHEVVVSEWSYSPSFGMGLEAGADWHLTGHLSAGIALSVYRGQFVLFQKDSWWGSNDVEFLDHPITIVPVGASIALRWAL